MNQTPTNSEQAGGSPIHLDGDMLLNLMFGLLSEAEEQPAFAHLEACPSCAQALQTLCARHERTRAGGAPRFVRDGQLVRAGEPAAAKMIAASFKRAVALLRRPTLAIAGAVAVAILVVAVWPRLTPEVAGPPGRGPAGGVGWLTTRDVGRQGGETGAEQMTEFNAAIRAYESRDLPRALELLTTARVPENVDAYRRVLLGSTLALSGRHAEASRVLLGAVEPELRDPLRLEAYQTLFATLLLSGRRATADSLLYALENHPGQLGGWARNLLRPAAPK